MTSEERTVAYMNRDIETRQEYADKSLKWCLRKEIFTSLFESKYEQLGILEKVHSIELEVEESGFQV